MGYKYIMSIAEAIREGYIRKEKKKGEQK